MEAVIAEAAAIPRRPVAEAEEAAPKAEELKAVQKPAVVVANGSAGPGLVRMSPTLQSRFWPRMYPQPDQSGVTQ